MNTKQVILVAVALVFVSAVAFAKPMLIGVAKSDYTPSFMLTAMSDIPIGEVQLEVFANPNLDQSVILLNHYATSYWSYPRRLGLAKNPATPEALLVEFLDYSMARGSSGRLEIEQTWIKENLHTRHSVN